MAADTHPTTTATATATSTIPSGPTINTQPAPPTPEKAPQPPSTRSLPQTLRLSLHRCLLHLLRATDYNLLRLTKLLSTPTGTDTLLCTLSYTLELLHAISSHILDHRLTTLATTLASKTNDVLLLPGETLIASLPAPPSTKAIAHIVGTTKALAAVIADFRIFVRLWGLVGIYTWARSTYLAGPLAADASAKEKLVRRITWAQIVSCVLFQFYENGAYLSSKGALTHASWAGDPGRARETWGWIVSSRWWAAHVFLELVRLVVLWRYEGKDNKKEGAKEEEDQVLNDGEKEAKLLVQQKQRANELWWRDLVSNLAYAPLTLHWSVHEGSGFLSNWGIGLCGMIAGGSLLVDAWRQTT